MRSKTFECGIHPRYYKELTSDKGIEIAPIPKRVVIPLQQHVGAPCHPLVKKGDEVSEGQKIGDVEAFVSCPVHASISGKVKDITPYPYPVGGKVNSIIIEGDGSSTDYPDGKDISLDLDGLSPEDIRLKVRESGIIGMGGAAFPTHVKLTPPKNVKIDTVLINACECEPYLTADHRLMLEESQRLMWGIKAVMKAVGAERAVIGVEVNKPDAIDNLKKELDAFKNIELVSLETKYPQGAEKMLIKAVLDRCVPVGKLPFDVGVVVNNVGTMVAIYHALRDNRPLIERVVTVTGKGIKEPKNLKLRIGATFREAIDLCGGLIGDGKTKVVMGGPMMGIAQMDLSVPTVKGTSGIVAFLNGDIQPAKYETCIRCARCIEACPMGIMPLKIGDFGRLHRIEEFKAFGGMACMECGCCSFVCPAKRPLVHWIRIGKVRLREADSREKSK